MTWWGKKVTAESPDRLFKVQVLTDNGTVMEHYCNAIRTNSGGQLWLMCGQSLVALYAPGRWASWSVVVPVERRDPKPEESGFVVEEL